MAKSKIAVFPQISAKQLNVSSCIAILVPIFVKHNLPDFQQKYLGD